MVQPEMESSSSSSPPPEESSSSSPLQQQKCTTTTTTTAAMFGSNCLILLSSPFPPHSPFSQPSPNPNPKPYPLHFSPPHILLRDFRHSILSTADNCLQLFREFVSRNPLLSQLSSLSSQFHNFRQIQCRSYRNLNSLGNHNFAAILPGDSVAGLVVSNGISNFLNLYNTLLVVRLVLTWFPNSPPAIVSPLSTLCDPYLNIFRGLIPPLGGTLDLSPILAFLVLNALTSTASALPAELPSSATAGVSREISSSGNSNTGGGYHLTTSQEKWMRRLSAGNNSPKNSHKEN